MQAQTQPKLISSQKSYQIRQKKPFSIHIIDNFYPQDGSLVYYLKGTSPPWLLLDKYRGILYGTAPTVHYDKVFKITITAINPMGHVIKSLILKVICTDIVDSMPPSLIYILNLAKQNYGLKHISLLAYMYVIYDLPEHQSQLQNFLQQAETEYDLKLSDNAENRYENFEKAIKSMNPDIEKFLRENLSKETLSAISQLNTDQFRNLVRMGSQQTGVHAIPVWNHSGYPDMYHWPEVLAVYSNVMDAASDDISKTQHANLRFHRN